LTYLHVSFILKKIYVQVHQRGTSSPLDNRIPTLRIGTRGSELALVQAGIVADLLKHRHVESSISVISTLGDRDQTSRVPDMGESGLFIREIESALLKKDIDIAVHSLKDLPVRLPDGLALASVPKREAAMDILISRDGRCLHELPPGSRIATGSPRRSAQVLALRPDLEVIPIRGNVPTRIQKLHDGFADAIILAHAGLSRLNREDDITEVLEIDTMTPAMGQGAIAIEARTGEFENILDELNESDSRHATDLERAFIFELGGGCDTPVGIHAQVLEQPSRWKLTGMIGSPDGKSVLRRSIIMNPETDGRVLEAHQMAREMIKLTSPELLRILNLKTHHREMS
jgi:hydroxymethylbilane synthase